MLVEVSIAVAMVLLIVLMFVLMGRNTRRRTREWITLADELGLRWWPEDELMSGEERRESPPGQAGDGSAQGTIDGYDVALFPFNSEWAIRVRLSHRFAGEVATYSPRAEPPGSVWVDTLDEDIDRGLPTRHFDPSLAPRFRETGLFDFWQKWRARLARFVIDPDGIRCHFRRGGGQPKHRFLEAQDARGIVLELLELAARIDELAGARQRPGLLR